MVMCSWRTVLAIAIALGIAAPAGAVVVGAGNGKKAGKHLVHGKVVAIQMDAGKGTGTLTVEVHHHKKNAASPSAPVQQTFKLTAGTKVEVVQGKKGAVQQTPANVGAVEVGQHVVIYHSGTDASDVKIVKKGKGKNKST
jgi:hypothetical protein